MVCLRIALFCLFGTSSLIILQHYYYYYFLHFLFSSLEARQTFSFAFLSCHQNVSAKNPFDEGRKEGRKEEGVFFGHFKDLLLLLSVYSSREFVLTCQILCLPSYYSPLYSLQSSQNIINY
jgi:hypothetical protein